MAIDAKKIPLAKEMIRKFRRNLAQFLEEGRPNKLYCLATQLFQLDKKQPEDKYHAD